MQAGVAESPNDHHPHAAGNGKEDGDPAQPGQRARVQVTLLSGDCDPSVPAGKIANVPRQHEAGQQRKKKRTEENPGQTMPPSATHAPVGRASSALCLKYCSSAQRLIVSKQIPRDVVVTRM